MAKIYTKTGDLGETGLIGGKRVPKNNIRVEAYGAIDEANAVLGMILARFEYFTHADELRNIQSMLFEVGAVLADPMSRNLHPDAMDVEHIEQLIDELTEDLAPLTNFILPGGSELSAHLHLARTVIRQAERRIITVMQHDAVPPHVIIYINRLSDYFFTLARKINSERNIQDIPWHKKSS